MARTMKVAVYITVEVDLDAMEAEYGLTDKAEIRQDVRYSFLSAGQQAIYPEESGVITSATLDPLHR